MAQLKGFPRICGKIVGVGRNYRAHASELGNAVPTKPILFFKPPSAIIYEGTKIELPVGCSVVDHEIELGVVISSTCKRVSESEASKYIGGYLLALDLTARDFQSEAKKNGLPWALAKGFDTSCPVSPVVPVSAIANPQEVELLCRVNGQLRQKGNTADMIFNIPYLISYISSYFTLEEGDLILTGTPAGVGPIKGGDKIEGEIPNVVKFAFDVTQRS